MAIENSGWGYARLRGALRNLGYEISRSTIKRILKEQGIEPAPVRGRKTSWATFIKAHLGVITVADFFTVEVLSMAGLIRYHVFIPHRHRHTQGRDHRAQSRSQWVLDAADRPKPARRP